MTPLTRRLPRQDPPVRAPSLPPVSVEHLDDTRGSGSKQAAVFLGWGKKTTTGDLTRNRTQVENGQTSRCGTTSAESKQRVNKTN